MNPINDLIAAQLSSLAYTPHDELPYLERDRKLPAQWRCMPELSVFGGTAEAPDRNNGMVVFCNDKERQIVFAFKGSDNIANFQSDLLNSGGTQWRSLRDNVDLVFSLVNNPDARSRSEIVAKMARTPSMSTGASLAASRNPSTSTMGSSPSGSPVAEMVTSRDLMDSPVAEHSNRAEPFDPNSIASMIVPVKNYYPETTGHSLGGEFAAITSIRQKISGRNQNGLPVSRMALEETDYPNGRISTFQAEHDRWLEAKCFMRATIIEGDIATWYYNMVRHETYINTETKLLPYPYNPSQTRDAQPRALTPTERFPHVVNLRKIARDALDSAKQLAKDHNPLHSLYAHLGSTVIAAIERDHSSEDLNTVSIINRAASQMQRVLERGQSLPQRRPGPRPQVPRGATLQLKEPKRPVIGR
jgi:hypothetical protein